MSRPHYETETEVEVHLRQKGMDDAFRRRLVRIHPERLTGVATAPGIDAPKPVRPAS
jgi:hypothetical protein